jgi:hypothetical protein
MNGRNFYSNLFCWLLLIGVASKSIAQTITSIPVPTQPVCPGSTISIPISTSGTFSPGNTFTAQLSDVTGDVVSKPTTIGSSTSKTISALIPATATDGTGYRIRIIPSDPKATAATSDPFTIKLTDQPKTTPTPKSFYCEGDAAPNLALLVTASSGATLNWYGPNKDTGTPSSTASQPDMSKIGTTPYYVSQTIGQCESSRASISVTVNKTPSAPSVTTPKAYCVGDVAGSFADFASGTSLKWYVDAKTTTALAGAPTVPTSTSGSTTYYVSQTVGGCEGPRSSIITTVNGYPNKPTVVSSVSFCQGASPSPLSATPEGGSTLRWWGTTNKGGSFSLTPTTPSNQTSATYYVSQEKNGCDGPTSAISVTVTPTPAAPKVGKFDPICVGGTAGSLTATADAGNTLRWWGTSQSGGTASSTPPAVDNKASATYYVSQVTKEGCESNRTGILAQINSLPSQPTLTSISPYCLNRKSRPIEGVSAAPGSTLVWYGTQDKGSGGTPSATAPVPPTDKVTPITYYVSQKDQNGCESPTRSFQIQVNSVPNPPAATTPNPYCEGKPAVALSASGTALKWYGEDSLNTQPSPTAITPSTSAASIGTKTYYVTQTVNGCESNMKGITVQVKDTPNAPATTDSDFCQNYDPKPLVAQPQDKATLNWYGLDQNSGLPSSTAPIPPKDVAKDYIYYVSQTLDGCEGPKASLKVTVKPTPAKPSVSPVSFCNNEPAQQLSAGGTGLEWYDANDKLLNGAPTPSTDKVEEQTFKVTQTLNGCKSVEKAILTVTIKPLPPTPGVADLTYCQTQQDQPAQNVSALTASGQNLRWYNPDGNGFPNAPIPSIDRAGVQTFQVSQTVNNCEGGKATLRVIVNTTPVPQVAKTLYSYCINDKAVPFQAIAEPGASLRWVNPYGQVRTEPLTPATENVNIDPQGDAFYVYQIGSNGCYSSRVAIRVIVNTTPTLALVAPVTNVNLGQKVPLQLKFTGSAPYSYSISEGYSGRSLKSDTTINVLPRGNTTYQVLTVTNGCGVGLPGNPATASVSVKVPTVSTSAFTATTLCAGTSLTVPFTTTGEFNQGNNFSFELASVADTSRKYSVSATAINSPVTGALPLTVASGQYYVRVKAANPEIGIIGSNSPTILTVRSLPTATLTGTQNIYEGSPANLTIALGGDGPWMVAYADSVRSYSATTTTSPYVVEVRPARNTTYRLTNVSNNCGTGVLSGTATIAVLPLLGIEDNSLDPLVKAYPVPTTSIVTVELDLPLTHDPATLQLTDLRGRAVFQSTTRNRRSELDLSTQPNGLYILRIQVGDRHTIRKVLKQ